MRRNKHNDGGDAFSPATGRGDIGDKPFPSRHRFLEGGGKGADEYIKDIYENIKY